MPPRALVLDSQLPPQSKCAFSASTIIRRVAYGRHLANTIKRPVLVGNAAISTVTVATCFHYVVIVYIIITILSLNLTKPSLPGMYALR